MEPIFEGLLPFDKMEIAKQMHNAIQEVLASRPNDPDFRNRVLKSLEKGRKELIKLGEGEMAEALKI